MRDAMYSTLVVPAVASYPTSADGCCGGGAAGVGSQAALTPQQRGTDDRAAVVAAAAAAESSSKTAMWRGCKCWWVAIAAVVVIALVANK